MQMVDSKKEKLPATNIVTLVCERQKQNLKKTMAQLLGAVTAEMSLKNAATVQVGNTVFLTHYGKDEKSQNKAVGRLFNVDTGRNLVSNTFRFFAHLQRKGVTHYTTKFETNEYLNLAKIVKRRVERETDTKVYIGKLKKGGYAVFVLFGTERLALGK